MKICGIDGLDNTGKTWTLDKVIKSGELEKLDIKYSNIHFPSDELCNTDVFKKLTLTENKYNHKLKIEFLNMLIKEETSFLRSEIDKGTDVVLIDRFLISSLIYQGEGGDYGWRIDKEIIKMYKNMFLDLNIKPSDFFNFIFIHKIKDDLEETNDSKLRFDAMGSKFKIKLNNILKNIYNKGPIYNEFFDKIHIFDEDIFKNTSIKPNKLELDLMDESRINKIVSYIYDEINGEIDGIKKLEA